MAFDALVGGSAAAYMMKTRLQLLQWYICMLNISIEKEGNLFTK